MYGHAIPAEGFVVRKILCLATGLLISATLVLADPPSDAEVIRGTWRLVTASKNGKKVISDSVFPTFMIVDANAMTYKNIPMTYRLDSSTNPRKMSFEWESQKTLCKFYAIYKLEKNRLTIAERILDGSYKVFNPEFYPASFDGGANDYVTVYARVTR